VSTVGKRISFELDADVKQFQQSIGKVINAMNFFMLYGKGYLVVNHRGRNKLRSVR
jgi:hypothetical protein